MLVLILIQDVYKALFQTHGNVMCEVLQYPKLKCNFLIFVIKLIQQKPIE